MVASASAVPLAAQKAKPDETDDDSREGEPGPHRRTGDAVASAGAVVPFRPDGVEKEPSDAYDGSDGSGHDQ